MASDRDGGFGSWRCLSRHEIFYTDDRPIPAPGTRRFQPLSARSRIPCGLRAALFRKLCRARISGQALAQPLSHQCFGAGIATMPNPRGLPGRHAGNAQSTRATGHAFRQGPSFTERRGVLQLGAAFVNSPPPCARYIPPPRMPHASLHTPFIFPSRGAGRLRLSIAAGLPLGPRQRAAPSPVATDLTSIHPSIRRIRCATRSSRNAPCCSSSACC